MSLKTFYLCESCEEKLFCHDICQHMVSLDHQLKYMWRNYPEFLQKFWLEDGLAHKKMHILNDLVLELSSREKFHKMDAECILLGPELHEFVSTASFREALKIVKKIKNGGKPSNFCVPVASTCKKSQHQEDGQGLPPQRISTRAVEMTQRCNDDISYETGCQFEKRTMVGSSGVLKDGFSNSPDVSCYSDEANPDVTELPSCDTDPPLAYTGSNQSLQPQGTTVPSLGRESCAQLKYKGEALSLRMMSPATVGPLMALDTQDEDQPCAKRPTSSPPKEWLLV
ncbi:uncharacterized protein LOC133461425 [Cololabis saira]|uniref:uncharacterized protein LOC133461425 n=1 Tax=Cololabis saira TaxID=129043 RepID=UPI002AD4B1C8|nr:uncharacterized protein LOC133461425 [Cololabis saira]